MLRLHRERKAKATIVLTPVENPPRLRPGRDRRRGQHPALPREAGRGRDHLRHDQRRHLRARAGHVRSHSEGHGVVDRAQLLPFADRARRDVRRVHLRRLLDRHRHAGEVHAGPPRHHGRPIPGAAVRRRAPRTSGSRPTRGSITASSCTGRASSTGRGGEGRRADRPYTVIGRQTHVEEARRDRRRDHLAERMDRPGSGRARVDRRPQLPRRPERHRRNPGACSATRPSSPTTADYDANS